MIRIWDRTILEVSVTKVHLCHIKCGREPKADTNTNTSNNPEIPNFTNNITNPIGNKTLLATARKNKFYHLSLPIKEQYEILRVSLMLLRTINMQHWLKTKTTVGLLEE